MALLFPALMYESNGSKWLLGNTMLPVKQSKFGAVGEIINNIDALMMGGLGEGW